MYNRMPTPRESVVRLEAEVAELKKRLADAFSVEEMDAIREQLAERAVLAERERDEAEAAAARAATEMRRVSSALATLLGEEDTVVTSLRPGGRRRMFA